MPSRIAITAASALMLSCAALYAQQARVGTTIADLQRHDLSTPGQEVRQVRVALAPGVSFPRHRHPGEEIIYVLEGSLEYQLEGQPPVTLHAGDVLFVPPGVVHSARNPGTVPGAELGTYVVEKGQPLTQIVD